MPSDATSTVTIDSLARPDVPHVIDKRWEAASKVISASCAWAGGAGLIPLPYVDLVALAAVQTRMATKIAELYGQSFSRKLLLSSVTILLATVTPAGIAIPVLSGLKAVPGLGSTLGFVVLPAFASASTYALGRVLVRHFEGGGTVASFSAEALKEDFQKEFRSVKTVNGQ